MEEREKERESARDATPSGLIKIFSKKWANCRSRMNMSNSNFTRQWKAGGWVKDEQSAARAGAR